MEERDVAKGDAVSRARELREAHSLLSNPERREGVIREAYGAMSSSAY